MKVQTFIIKIFILTSLLICTYYFFAHKLANSFVDDNYCKFTKETQSIIVGMSRAHDGISPSVLKAELSTKNIDLPILNFAIERSQSPYGEVYLNAIKKKIKPKTKNGIFILSVTPGNFFISERLNNDKEIFKIDKKTIVGKVNNLNIHPNYEYIRKCFSNSLYRGLYFNDYRITTVIHDDGWKEFKLQSNSYKISDQDIKKWTKETIEGYQAINNNVPQKKSEYRMNSFIKTIKYLKNHGKVFLTRLPINEKLLEFENMIDPNFNKEMKQIALDYEIEYFDYSNQGNKFGTYDGSHLYSNGAIEFTKELAKEIEPYLD